MLTTTSAAFKEWASVVKALGLGEQILILRKGGIHEKGKSFSVLHESFYLFPTYEHQKPEDLNARGRELLEEVKTRASLTDRDHVTLEYYAKVEKSLWISDFQRLLALSPYHVWSEHALQKRYEWGEDQSVYALIVRVFRLPEPAILKNLPKYGGCRSWVELEHPGSTFDLCAVLTDQEFHQRLQAIKRILSA